MSTDRPDWFGTADPDDDGPARGQETSRGWFEEMAFERTDPGTVERDDPGGEVRTVAGADAAATTEPSPGTDRSAPSGDAGGDHRTGSEARPGSGGDGTAGTAPIGSEGSDGKQDSGGSLLARLKSLFGL